jgi:hypothetical protein
VEIEVASRETHRQISTDKEDTDERETKKVSARVGVSRLAARICMRGFADVERAKISPSTGWEEPQLAVARRRVGGKWVNPYKD